MTAPLVKCSAVSPTRPGRRCLRKRRPSVLCWSVFDSPARVVRLILVLTLAFPHGAAFANPTGGTVVSGSADIVHESATQTTIYQHSNTAIIDWRGFSIAAGETTHFQQNSSSSLAVNRVTGSDPSHIFGNLTATGQIMLINQNGILFGRTSRVDVAGLVATTIDIPNQRILNGDFRFDQSTNPVASVINRGNITVRDGGLAALVAPGVENTGVIQARLGRVELASANGFTVDLYGDGLIKLPVDSRASGEVLRPDGTPLSAAVSNSGRIEADGGTVVMSAQTATGMLDRIINMDGIIQARSVANINGEIVLSGGEEGIVAVSGTLDASGTAAGETGGKVIVFGEKVGLFDDAAIDASGDAGGGEILVGGHFQGKGPASSETSSETSGAASGETEGATTSFTGEKPAVDSDVPASGEMTADGIAGNQSKERTATTSFTGEKPAVDSDVPASGEMTADGIAGNQGKERTATTSFTGDKPVVDADASAAGKMQVGGEHKSFDLDQNAVATVVAENVTIKADALGHGDGGKVIFWADDITKFYGNITATGGGEGGNGGFAEVSGKQYLDFQGVANLTATAGETGILLLDPNNITIQDAGGDTNIGGNPNFATTNDGAILLTATIEAALAGANVTVTTGTAGANSDVGNIWVNNAIDAPNSAFNLSLSAHRNVVVAAPINMATNGGTGTLTLTADSDTNESGNVNLNAAAGDLTTNGATINITGVNFFAAAGAIVDSNGGDITIVNSTPARQINFSGTPIASSFEISDAVLDGIRADAGNIFIGNAAQTGNIVTTNAVSFGGTANSITLQTGGTINISQTFNTAGTNLTLTGENITLGNNITAAGATVTIQPQDAGDTIVLGTNPGSANSIELNDVELDRITAGTLVIGSATAGAATITADISPANITNLHIIDNSTITGTAGGIVVGNLALTAAGTINFTDTTTNVTNLAVSNAGQAVTFTEADGVTIGSVNGVNGITSAALTVNANNGVTVAQNVTTTGIATVDTDFDNNGAGDFTVNTATALSTTNNALSVTANDIVISGTGTLNSGAAATTLLVSDAGTIGLGGTAGNWTLSGAELQQITATGLTIGDATNGNITVNGITAANSNNITGTTTLNATLDNASIAFSTGASTFNALAANADQGIAVNVGLTTDVGNMALEGDADNAADTGDAIAIAAGLTITSAGSMTLDSTTGNMTGAGALTLNAVGGVTLNDSLTTAGATTVDTDTDNNGVGDLSIAATKSLATTGNNNITITANEINFNATGAVNSGTGVTTVVTSDNAGIDLGAAGTGGMVLSDAEIDLITAGTLRLGGAAEGAITLNAAITPANAATLRLESGGTISDTGAGTIAVTNLQVNGVNATLDNVANDVTTYAGTASQASGTPLVFVDANGFTVGTVDGLVGTNSIRQSLTAETGNITVNNLVTSTRAVTITAKAANALVTTNAQVRLTNNSSRTLNIFADNMDLNAAVNGGGGSNVVTLAPYTAGVALDIGSTTDAAGSTLELSATDLANVSNGVLEIGNTTAGAITVTTADVTMPVGTVKLISNGAVNGSAFGITATSLAVDADGAVTLTDANTDTNNIAIFTTTGNIAYTDLDGFNVTTVRSVTGVDTNAGTVALTATTGNIAVVNTAAANDVEATGDITLTAVADEATVTVNATADVESSAGNISVVSDIISLPGTLTASAGANQTVTLAPETAVDADVVDVGTDATIANRFEITNAMIDQITTDTVVIGTTASGALTVSADITPANATGLHLRTGGALTATAGGIIETNLAVNAGGAVTFSDAQQAVTTLAISATGQTVNYTEATGFDIGSVNGVNGATAGTLNLTAGGALTDSQAIIATNLSVTNTAAATTLNSAANDVNTLAINGTGQTVTFVDTDGFDIGTVNAINGITATTVGLTAGGALTDSQAITATGLAITNTAAATTLDVATSDVTTLAVNAAGQTASFRDANAVDIGTVSGVGGITATTFALTAGGAVTDSQVINVTNLALTAGGAVTLNTFTSDVTTLAISAVGQTVAFRDANSIDIGSVAGVNGVTAGTFTLTSGPVTDSQAITATNLAISASGAVTLDVATNDVDTVAINTTTGNIQMVDADDLTVGTVSGISGIDTNNGGIILTAGTNLTITDTVAANDMEANTTLALNFGTASALAVNAGANAQITGQTNILGGAASGTGTLTVGALVMSTQSTNLNGTVGGAGGAAGAAAVTTQAPLGAGPHLFNGVAFVASATSTTTTPQIESDAVTVSVAAENSQESGSRLGSVSTTPDGPDSDGDSTPQEAVVQDMLIEPIQPDIFENLFQIVRYTEEMKQILGLSAAGVDDIWSDGDALSPPQAP